MAEDMPDFEAQRRVRDAYARIAEQAGSVVAAAAVRDASGLSDTAFKQAVQELAACPDMAMSGYSVYTTAWGNRTAAQIQDIKDRAPLVGGQHVVSMAIGGPGLPNIWRPERATTQSPQDAATQARWLPRTELEWMGATYGVDASGSDQTIRDRITAQASINHDHWRAAVRQETADLELLYAADQAGADAVVSWPGRQRSALAEAAIRQSGQSWPIGRERAERWLATLTGEVPPGPGRVAGKLGTTASAARLAAAFETPPGGRSTGENGTTATRVDASARRAAAAQPAAHTTGAGRRR